MTAQMCVTPTVMGVIPDSRRLPRADGQGPRTGAPAVLPPSIGAWQGARLEPASSGLVSPCSSSGGPVQPTRSGLGGPLVDWGFGAPAGRTHSAGSAGGPRDAGGWEGASALPGAAQPAAVHMPRSGSAPSAQLLSAAGDPGMPALAQSNSDRGFAPVCEDALLPLVPSSAPQAAGSMQRQQAAGSVQQAARSLAHAGSARSERLEGAAAGLDAAAPRALELRLPPLHPKRSARLALLAAGGGSLFAGEPLGGMPWRLSAAHARRLCSARPALCAAPWMARDAQQVASWSLAAAGQRSAWS